MIDELVKEAYDNAVANGDKVEIDAMDDFELACDMADKVAGLEDVQLALLEVVIANMRSRMVG